MEEKERYTIESFEIEEPSFIFDNKTQQIILTLVYYNYDEITHLKDLLNQQDKRIKEYEAKLADSEKQIKDARETANMSVDSWCKNRRKYEAQIAEMQNKSFILYSTLYETLEKQGCENVASQIDQMTGWTYDKEADWLKGNRNYDQLKEQLAEKERKLKLAEELVVKYYVYNWGDKIQQDKVYSITGEALELLINRPNKKAIEQLEKVKRLLNGDYRLQETNYTNTMDYYECLNIINEYIDNQIKQLKEGK